MIVFRRFHPSLGGLHATLAALSVFSAALLPLSVAGGMEEPPSGKGTSAPADGLTQMIRSAEKAFASGHLAESGSLYHQALKVSPENPRLMVSAAAVETRMGNLRESDRLLRIALRLDPANGTAWLLLGMNALEARRDEEAFAALAQASFLDGSNPRAHNYLGIACGRRGWGEASEQELRRAVELDSSYADANFNLAVLYLRRTPPLLELARRHYQRARELGSPRDPAVELQLAATPPHSASAATPP